jgi:flavin reductase (DIM6/NTAB) family NADH-FMN oxidoreductase RutF
MLRADQGTLSRVFASKLPEHEKFEGVAHRLHDDVPIIDGALAWLTCDLVGLHPGGDHTIGVGAVREMAPEAHGDPLVWYRGDYRGIV